MDPTPLSTLAQWTGARLTTGAEVVATVVCTDSRALKAGDLFVALKGDNFDGHQFVAEAARLGAVGAVVQAGAAQAPAGFPLLEVEDTLKALQTMAGEYRRTLGSLKTVGITGSNGKTSTKDLCAAVLGARFKVTCTVGNLNNHIGVPLSVLRATSSDEVGVFEMGMNHPGELAPLAAIAAPVIGIITNIGVAHIEYMGSREAIAQEKGMVAEALPADGHLFMCAEDDFSASIAARSKARTILVGIGCGEISASELDQDFEGTSFRIDAFGKSARARIGVPGVHMVRNALLAIGAGLVSGMELEQCVEGLSRLNLTKGRLQQKLIRGIRVLDDSYNANPDSVKAALRTLAQVGVEGRRIAVLGRMGELGHFAEEGHRSVGEVAGDVGIDILIGVGDALRLTVEAARGRGVASVIHVATLEEAIRTLRGLAHAGDAVLVKGSRSTRMERIVEALEKPEEVPAV